MDHSGGVTEHAKAVPSVLTATELAVELRCSKAHVHNLLKGKFSGLRLPSIRIGRRVLVRREALCEWLKAVEGL